MNVVKTGFFISLVIIYRLFAQDRVSLDERGKEGEVIFEAVSAWGDRLSQGVHIRATRDGRLVHALTDERVVTLPYGSYHIEASTGGAYRIDKRLVVDSPRQVLPLFFFIAPIETPEPGNLVRARISTRAQENKCLWVRFMLPFSDGLVYDTKASSTGFFALERIRPGRYIVLTIGPAGICEGADVSVLYGPKTHDLNIKWRTLHE